MMAIAAAVYFALHVELPIVRALSVLTHPLDVHAPDYTPV